MLVFVPGCFDSPVSHKGLHAGHAALLRFVVELAAFNAGTEIVVAINDDESVRRLKGQARPLKKYVQRRDDVLSAVATFRTDDCWSVVVCGFDGDVEKLLITTGITPDVMVKGSEYAGKPLPGEALCKRVVLAPMRPGVSTTILEKNDAKHCRVHDLP
jgi:D-beta-D-heptose 7-phosphate kinase/D-beta-D-heptose 1-phosphate adenosyltransferase